MRRGAYYNEFDPFASQWIREMIKLGVLAPGEVDGRSIKDVTPDDLKGFTQCHFFAGIGGWAYAARLAGWPDDRPLWTGSCPCQPFSTAGRGRGHDDPRDLWPHFFRLIRAARPPVVVGEQVAGKAGEGWFDRVRADLARADYAGRPVDIPACAVDAPHIRQRLYWASLPHSEAGMADALGERSLGGPCQSAGDLGDRYPAGWGQGADRPSERDARNGARAEDLADPSGARRLPAAHAGIRRQAQGGGSRYVEPQRLYGVRALVDASGDGRGEGRPERGVWSGGNAAADPDAPGDVADAGREFGRAGPGQPQDGHERSDLYGSRPLGDADRQRLFSGGRGCAPGAPGSPEVAGQERQRLWTDARQSDEPRGLADADGGRPAAERRDAAEVSRLSLGEGRSDERPALPGRGDDAAYSDLGDAGGQGLALGPIAEVGGGNVRDQGSAPGAPVDRAGGPRDVADADVAVVQRLASARQLAEYEQDARTHLRAWARNGTFWSDAEWIVCHDGKARRTEPGVPLLAHGILARVPKWRGFGNAICPPLAAEVLGALLDVLPDDRALDMAAA